MQHRQTRCKHDRSKCNSNEWSKVIFNRRSSLSHIYMICCKNTLWYKSCRVYRQFSLIIKQYKQWVLIYATNAFKISKSSLEVCFQMDCVKKNHLKISVRISSLGCSFELPHCTKTDTPKRTRRIWRAAISKYYNASKIAEIKDKQPATKHVSRKLKKDYISLENHKTLVQELLQKRRVSWMNHVATIHWMKSR